MLTDGGYVDGSWELSIYVDDLAIEKTLRVHGDSHLGGIMFSIVESLDFKMNWSDHALWWPAKNCWLLHTRSTLDQCGVQADSKLRFLQMHNPLRIQLPDLQTREVRVNYAQSVFGVVVNICKELAIRHPEELSLMRPFGSDDLKKPRIWNLRRPLSNPGPDSPSRYSTYSGRGPSSPVHIPNDRGSPTPGYASSWSYPQPRTPLSPLSTPAPPLQSSQSPYESSNYTTMIQSPNGTLDCAKRTTYENGNGESDFVSVNQFPHSLNSLAFEGADESQLAHSPLLSSFEAFELRGMPKPKNFIQRARINGAWLDSSRSLMEQCLEPNSDVTPLLRFKYFTFYDLNLKYDSVRINQIFHQCRWAILSEEVECTEEEMLVFAGFQLQIQLQNAKPQAMQDNPMEATVEDEIDGLLTELELSLENNSTISANSLTEGKVADEVRYIPQLSAYLKYYKPRRFALKNFKEFWMVLRDTTVTIYKTEVDASEKVRPLESLNLRGCELQPDVNISTQKFDLRVFVPNGNLMQEVWIRCPSEEVYAEWSAACRLASRGKTLASKSLFEAEKQTTLSFLRLQAPKAQPILTMESMPKLTPEDFVVSKYIRKYKPKLLLQRILDAHANVRHLSLMDAKLQYIKACQQLPQYGIAYFVVRFHNQKREHLIGVSHNRLMRMDLSNGDNLKTWRFSELRSWHVNWEVKHLVLNFARDRIAFHPVSSTCKIIHEMVGGYIFLSMRTPEKNQDLDEALFQKFTGGTTVSP